ncbi:DUF4402 domain-containing protein [Rhizorhabdus sp. FW153]|uniref:DUF4402 domain-containing protein n=1 Tax=Rhizorhabdus sp. FW153 TaxID=3400216 RepID=UPI003CF242F8
MMIRSGTTFAAMLLLSAGLTPSASGQGQSTASTDAGVTITQPSGVTTEQAVVIGAVTVPLLTNIGTSVGSTSLPLPTGFSAAPRLSVGTEAAEQIAQGISPGLSSQASFTLLGNPDQVVSISVPQTVSLLRLNGQGEVEFSTTTNITGGGGTRLVAFGKDSGALAFDVGGALQPNASAEAGNYAGVLVVAVQYN